MVKRDLKTSDRLIESVAKKNFSRQYRSKARDSARGHLGELTSIIEKTFDLGVNPRREFALMFNDPDMLRKVVEVIYPVVAAGVSNQVLTLGKLFDQCVSDDKVDAAYIRVKSHLTKHGKWSATIRRFPDIRHIVKKVLEREPSSEFDLIVEFETLRDYDCLEDWFGKLEWDRKISRDYSEWAFDCALEEVEVKAEYLGRVLVPKFEYNRLLRLNERYGKLDKELHKRKRPGGRCGRRRRLRRQFAGVGRIKSL